MALIVVRDAKQKRERILNRVDMQLRDNVYVEGTIAEFAKQVGAAKVGIRD